MHFKRRIVAVLLFASGFCALVYQTTWLREFRLVFGMSTAATAAVVGVFMAGLGFGGFVLGRCSETKTRPLAFYAQLEFLLAISAALTPLLILAGRNLYIFLGGTGSMGIPLGTFARLILTTAILGIPTFLMGGTLPAAVRSAAEESDAARRTVGILYGANTLGAVTGAAVTTFYCFEHFGNRRTLWLASSLNIIVALVASYFSKRFGELPVGVERPVEVRPEPISQINPRFVLSAAGVVGFAFFLMELVWYRMLGPLLGGSTFCFGLILAVALLGIGLGGAAYAWFDWRRSASLHVFALTCAAEALFIALPYGLGDRIAILAMLLRDLGAIGFSGYVLGWTTICMIVVFPAAVVAGLQFPLLIALLGRGTNCVGLQTGATYGWNTVGALVGALSGGFGLIRLLTAPGVWKMVTLLLGLLALVAVALSVRERRSWKPAVIPFFVVAIALSLLLTTGPTAFWRQGQIGVGGSDEFQASPNELYDLVRSFRRETLWEVDGIESGVALSKEDSLSFLINGKVDGNAKNDVGTQIMSGLIGAALHPHPTTAMVIGLGTGSTAGWLSAVPTITRVDVAELEPGLLTVADACSAVNHDALKNPKLHVTLGDARETLMTEGKKYDVIVSEPSQPYRAGVASLFTREFYESVKQHLDEHGMFLQWLQSYKVDNRTIQTIYRTIGSVFPNIETWMTQGDDLLLLASREPVSYNAQDLRARFEQEPLKSALLHAWRAQGLEDFLAHFVSSRSLAAPSQQSDLSDQNTDDRTIVEFAFARSAHRHQDRFDISRLLAATHAAGVDRPQHVAGEVNWSRVDEGRISMFSDFNEASDFRSLLTGTQPARARAFASYQHDDLRGALQEWQAQPEQPQTLSQVALVAESLAATGDKAALGYIEKLGQAFPQEAEAIRARFFWSQGNGRDAALSLETFFRTLHDDPWPASDLIRRSLELALDLAKYNPPEVGIPIYGALRSPFRLFNNERQRATTLVNLGLELDRGDPGQYTVGAVEQFEPHVPWNQNFLHVRWVCYAAVQNERAEKARRDFDEFMKRQSPAMDVSTFKKEIRSPTSGAPP